jgi:hypothetical protein
MGHKAIRTKKRQSETHRPRFGSAHVEGHKGQTITPLVENSQGDRPLSGERVA